MIGLLVEQAALLASGAVSEAVSNGGDALWVPGGMFLTACELLRRAALAYKEARQVDVDGARKRETEAQVELDEVRKARDDLRADYTDQVESLRGEIEELRREVNDLKGSHRTSLRDMEERHANEIAQANNKIVREVRVAYLLREHMAANGLPIPDDLFDADHGR